MKNKLLAMAISVMCLTLNSCIDENKTSDVRQTEETEVLMQEAHRQAGLPNIVNFNQKKTLKMIQELCDQENLICYAYLKSEYNGKLTFLGKCLGYGIPFAAQYTNPEKVVEQDRSVGRDITGFNGVISVPMPDPNGLYMPTSSSATWLIMINPEDQKPKVVYIEPEIVVSPFPLGNIVEKETN